MGAMLNRPRNLRDYVECILDRRHNLSDTAGLPYLLERIRLELCDAIFSMGHLHFQADEPASIDSDDVGKTARLAGVAMDLEPVTTPTFERLQNSANKATLSHSRPEEGLFQCRPNRLQHLAAVLAPFPT